MAYELKMLKSEREYEAFKKECFEIETASQSIHPWESGFQELVSKITTFADKHGLKRSRAAPDVPLVEYAHYLNGRRLPHGVHCSKCNLIRKLREDAR